MRVSAKTRSFAPPPGIEDIAAGHQIQMRAAPVFEKRDLIRAVAPEFFRLVIIRNQIGPRDGTGFKRDHDFTDVAHGGIETVDKNPRALPGQSAAIFSALARVRFHRVKRALGNTVR